MGAYWKEVSSLMFRTIVSFRGMQTTVIILVMQNTTLIKTHHLWCFEHVCRLEVRAVKKKFKIAGGLFNCIKNNLN